MSDTKAKAEGKKKSPLPLIIGIVALVAILFVGKTMMGAKKDDKPKKEKKHHKSSEEKDGKDSDSKDSDSEGEEAGISLPLDEFLVNLNGGGEHYLRTTIALGLKKGLTEEQVKEHVAPMRDAILTILSTKTFDEMNKPKDRDKLKAEIRDKVNEEVEKEPVAKVYFTAFATQ